jgi:hypothetical protein
MKVGAAPRASAEVGEKLRLSAFCLLSSFPFFSLVPHPTVMDPAVHCRIDLTKVGAAVRFLAFSLRMILSENR